MSKIFIALIVLTIGNAQGAEALRMMSQKQACLGLTGLTDYIGTDCDPKACQAVTEPAGSHVNPQYPGPLCVCKPCPAVAPKESSSQFDKVLYNCLVNGLQYCPVPVSTKADGSSNTTQRSSSSKSFEKDATKGDKPTGSQEQATKATAEEAATIRVVSQAQNLIGLAIGLCVSIGGFAFLGIWFFLDCKRNNNRTDLLTKESGPVRERLTHASHGVHVTSSPENAPV